MGDNDQWVLLVVITDIPDPSEHWQLETISFGTFCLQFTYSPSLQCNYNCVNLQCPSLAQRGLANRVVRAVPAEPNTRPGDINISKDNETNSARSYIPV